MLQTLAGFRPGLKLTAFTLLLLPVLLGLGLWQLDREQEKLALQAVHKQRMASRPHKLDEIQWSGELQFMPVRMTGEYDNQRTFLLDNRTWQSRAGFEVISPLLTDQGHWVLVNRGWVAQGQYRQDVPELQPVSGRVTLEGSVYVPAGEQVMLGEDAPFSGWPRIIQAIDLPQMQAELGISDASADLFPYTVRLASSMPGVLTRNWQVITTTPEKHRGYAVQWFSMALVLVLLFLYRGFKADNTEMGQNPDHGK